MLCVMNTCKTKFKHLLQKLGGIQIVKMSKLLTILKSNDIDYTVWWVYML